MTAQHSESKWWVFLIPWHVDGSALGLSVLPLLQWGLVLVNSRLECWLITNHRVSLLIWSSLGFPIGGIQIIPTAEICGEGEE